jgi:hypothetical protein
MTPLCLMSDPHFCLFDHTTTLITAFYIPSFVAFTSAIQKNVDYVIPTLPASYVFMNHQNATFYINTISQPQVQWAWGIFLFLFLFGSFMACIILSAHASYHNWPSFAHHYEASLTHGQRMAYKHHQALQRKWDEENKKYDNTSLDDNNDSALAII